MDCIYLLRGLGELHLHHRQYQKNVTESFLTSQFFSVEYKSMLRCDLQ